MPIVVEDPGHNSYGQDTGAEGNELREQDVTLAICREIRPLLQANGITVVLTRDGDLVTGLSDGYTLDESLRARVAISDNANADLFVSVHINSGGGTGEEVLIAGTGGKAYVAANILLARINQVTGWANRGVKVQNVYVLRNTSMPAILTENGFIDSVSDSAKLKDPAFIHALAVAHAKGICDYFGITYKESGPVIITQAPEPSRSSAPQQHTPDPVPALNFTYPNNAKVIKDDLFIRDANGSIIPGRYVSNGDNITVLDVGYRRQLALVEYPTSAGVRKGYVANAVSCLQYYHQGEWVNGSTPEAVLDDAGAKIGSLDPRERATPLYRKNGMLHVVYNTAKGINTKSGYVAWDGGFSKF